MGGVKTTVITTAGLYNAVVGVYATALDFLATNFFESEIDILLKQMSVYNNDRLGRKTYKDRYI